MNELNDYLTNKDKSKIINKLLRLILSLTLNENEITVFNIIGLNKFKELINIFENKEIRFSSKNDFENSLIIFLIYYYKEIENKSWKEIKQLCGIDLKKDYIKKFEELKIKLGNIYE